MMPESLMRVLTPKDLSHGNESRSPMAGPTFLSLSSQDWSDNKAAVMATAAMLNVCVILIFMLMSVSGSELAEAEGGCLTCYANHLTCLDASEEGFRLGIEVGCIACCGAVGLGC